MRELEGGRQVIWPRRQGGNIPVGEVEAAEASACIF